MLVRVEASVSDSFTWVRREIRRDVQLTAHAAR